MADKSDLLDVLDEVVCVEVVLVVAEAVNVEVEEVVYVVLETVTVVVLLGPESSISISESVPLLSMASSSESLEALEPLSMASTGVGSTEVLVVEVVVCAAMHSSMQLSVSTASRPYLWMQEDKHCQSTSPSVELPWGKRSSRLSMSSKY